MIPPSVDTPVTCSAPSAPLVPTTPCAATPRQTVTPGVASTVRATASSMTGRRAVEDLELLVAVAQAAAAQGVVLEHVRPERAELVEGLRDRREVAIGLGPPAGHQEVGVAELPDAGSRPVRPGPVDAERRRRGVALQDRDAVTVLREEHGGLQADQAGTEDDDIGHGELPIDPEGEGRPRRSTGPANRASGTRPQLAPHIA